MLDVDHHDHHKELVHDRLRYIQDIGTGLCQFRRNAGDDADAILADDSNDDTVRVHDESNPVANSQEIGIKLGLRRARLGRPVIAPFHRGRQRHQNGFRASTGLESEQCSTVVDQIELDITSTAVGLKIALGRTKWQILAPFDDWQIRLQNMITYAARKCEASFKIRLGQVIEKDTADTTRFAAMPKIK